MLKPKRKITIKEIKQDPLLETIFKGQQYFNENKRLITRIGGGILLVVTVLISTTTKEVKKLPTEILPLTPAPTLGDFNNFLSCISNMPSPSSFIFSFILTSAGNFNKCFLRWNSNSALFLSWYCIAFTFERYQWRGLLLFIHYDDRIITSALLLSFFLLFYSEVFNGRVYNFSYF